MKAKFLFFLIITVLTSCKKEDSKRNLLLSADREAPIGWIYLNLYDNDSFEFISKGVRNGSNYIGTYKIKNDSIYFKYKDSIPSAGSTAVLRDNLVIYVDGKYPERLQISKINISKE